VASTKTSELLAMHPAAAAAEPPSPLEREPALVAMLAEAEARVDGVLDDMPEAFVDARRLIGRELWPLPRPEELQTIIKIASDKKAQGPRRDLPRRFLALRLVSEQLIRAYWDPMLLDPGAIWCRAEDLRTVVEAVERLEALLEPGQGASSDVAFEDRVYLKTVARALAPRRDLIGAAITLAHPFVEIMEVAGADDVRGRIPSLTHEEAELLRLTAVCAADGELPPAAAPEPAEDGVGEGSEAPADPASDPARRHIALEVLTVRWLIHGDIAEWEELFREAGQTHAAGAHDAGERAHGAAHGTSPAQAEARTPADSVDMIAGDEAQDDDAVWVIDDAAPGAESAAPVTVGESRSEDDADEETASAPAAAPGRSVALTQEQIELRHQIHTRALQHQILYGVVSERLQKIQDEALLMRQKETTEWLAAFRRPLVASYARLLTVVRDQVPGAPAPEARTDVPDDEPGETFEQIFEKAVSDVEEKKAADEAEKAAVPKRKLRRARMKRLAVMGAAILVLGSVAVGVHFLLPKPPPDALVFSPSEARNVISLSETHPIGTMLYAKLSGQWDPFSIEERQREIESLARIATEHGFTSIYLVDESGEPLAQWDQTNGPKIVQHEAPSKVPMPSVPRP